MVCASSYRALPKNRHYPHSRALKEPIAQPLSIGPLSLTPGDIGAEGDVGVRTDTESSVGDVTVFVLDDVDRFRDKYGLGNGF